jgi:hypothetical protein
MSVSTSAIWIFAYLANQFFPLMQKHLGTGGLFFFFAIMAAADLLFVFVVVPETKGYTLEQITTVWASRQSRHKGI